MFPSSLKVALKVIVQRPVCRVIMHTNKPSTLNAASITTYLNVTVDGTEQFQGKWSLQKLHIEVFLP